MEERVYGQLYAIEKKHWWFAARQEILLKYVDSRLRLNSSSRVLDVGCGTGAILDLFSHRYDAYGTDMSPQAIDFCRQRGLTRLHQGSLDSYPPTEPFDLITMLDVVEHVEDDLGFLRIARGLLRNDGHILVAVPAFPVLWSIHDEILHHQQRYTKRTLQVLITEAGFTIEHLTFFNAFLFPVALARRLAARIRGSEEASDLEIPPPPLNEILRRIFLLEGGILPHASLPFGLSLLCLAYKGGA